MSKLSWMPQGKLAEVAKNIDAQDQLSVNEASAMLIGGELQSAVVQMPE